MNIGIVTPSIYMYQKRYGDRIFAPGDLARTLVDGLAKRGHTVTWFTAPGEKTSADVVVGDTTLLDTDLKIRVFQDIPLQIREKMSLYGTKMYYELDILAKAFTKAKEKHIDLMHVFHSFGYFAQFFSEVTGIPTVFTLHDPLPTTDMLESWLMHRFDGKRYIAISASQMRGAEERFVGVVPHGIDGAKFPFQPDAGEQFISLGRMVAEKGYEDALQAVVSANASFTIASWLNDTVKQSDYFTKKILPYIDGKKIRLSDLLEGSKKIQFLQNAKALLFPIHWEEPFGMVMIEAMSCGTPVIAYNRGSVPEIVKDGVTGFIIDPPEGDDTPYPLGQHTIKERGIDGLVMAMNYIGNIDRTACRSHVEEHFSIETMVKGYEQIYKIVLSKTT